MVSSCLQITEKMRSYCFPLHYLFLDLNITALSIVDCQKRLVDCPLNRNTAGQARRRFSLGYCRNHLPSQLGHVGPLEIYVHNASEIKITVLIRILTVQYLWAAKMQLFENFGSWPWATASYAAYQA